MKFFVPVFLLIAILLHHSQATLYTADQYRDFARKCSKILGISAESMQQMKDTNYISDDREVHCLVRCMGILTELYDDETGNNWDLLAQLMDDRKGFEKHRQAATECIRALPQDELQSDVCRKSYLLTRCAN